MRREDVKPGLRVRLREPLVVASHALTYPIGLLGYISEALPSQIIASNSGLITPVEYDDFCGRSHRIWTPLDSLEVMEENVGKQRTEAIKVVSQVTTTRTVTLNDVDILRVVGELIGSPVGKGARVSFQVPGGGDWSNTAIEIDDEHPIVVSWSDEATEVLEIPERKP